MRILTFLQRWILKNRFASSINRRGCHYYRVNGAFGFQMAHYSSEHDLVAMRKAICEIDAEFPYDSYPDIKFESIGYLSEGTITLYKDAKPLKIVWFFISPKWYLRTDQICAYECHLAKIAEELVRRFAGKVSKIHSVIDIKSGTTFSA